MTIHADWLKAFREWAPEAFSGEPIEKEEENERGPTTTTERRTGYIDGQIKLMGMPHPENGPPTWELFIKAQFVSSVEAMWR